MVPEISIVIVNYNAGGYLERCLKSLEEQTLRQFEVIVVDNASRDQSMLAAERRASLQVIRNRENRGFAAAQNQGLHIACGKYWMPLNFDIHLMPDYLEKVVAAFETYPLVGTVSGKIMRMQPDGSWTSKFDNAGLLLSRRRKPLHRGIGEEDCGQYQRRDYVFGALGAAAAFRSEMLKDIAFHDQFFDESFFTWYEDVDLDWRARLRGWDCLYLPDAIAFHVGDPQKNLITPFAAKHSIRNRWQMILSNDCLHCMTRDARWLIYEEFALLRHVVKYRRFQAYLMAFAGLIGHLPWVLAKRRWVRGRVKRTCLPEYPQPITN